MSFKAHMQRPKLQRGAVARVVFQLSSGFLNAGYRRSRGSDGVTSVAGVVERCLQVSLDCE